MKDTIFSLSREQQNRQAMGHVGDQPYFMLRNTPMKPWNMGEMMTSSGGAYSTVTDLLIYAKHTLAMGKSRLNPILIKITEPKVKQQDGEMSALGWTISDFGDEHTTITYKHGMVSGYSAYIGLNMSKKIAVVVLCLSTGKTRSAIIFFSAFPNLPIIYVVSEGAHTGTDHGYKLQRHARRLA
jgi:hypothetical protein